MSTLQQIVYTDHPERWHDLARALGLVPAFAPVPEWSEFDGDGVLAVHRASASRPAGRAEMTVLVDDLEAAARGLAGFAVEHGEMADVGAVVSVTSEEGIALTVAEDRGHAAPRGLIVEPIWFQRDLDEPRRILEALGFTVGIVGDDGGWAQLGAPGGGSVGLHAGVPRVEASFREEGDLDALAARVREAGFRAAIIDESYARTLRVEDPDGGAELWINGRQDDLYGYRDERGPA